ncbi:MAG: methyltransferase domain-containing protein [Pseudomonadota bacterium]
MQDLDYTAIFSFRGKAYNEAMAAFPEARENERAAMIRLFDLGPEDHFCDVPAGGGYLSDGIVARFGRELAVTCVEPAEEFGAVIDPAFRVINSPMVDVPVADESFTALGSLAGLHHVEDRNPTFAEWHRLLVPGGQLGVADVAAGSAVGEFLNGFVDKHTPQGHDGIFIGAHEFEDLMHAHGFDVISEETVSIPWVFPTREAVGAFCKKLFFLETATAEDVTEGIHNAVGIEHDKRNDRWLMNWELIYAFGRKIG